MKKGKRLFSIILAIIMLVSTMSIFGISAFASDSIIEDDSFYYSLCDNELTVLYAKNKSYKGKSLVIPAEVIGYKVKHIKEGFGLMLAGQVIYYDGMFINTSDYRIPNRSNTVKSVVINAQFTNDYLNEAYADDYYWETPSQLINMPTGGLFSCFKNLEKVILPDSMTVIRTNMFANCKKLSTINMPKSLQVIENKAFFNCQSLNGTITIGKNVKDIQGNPFANCFDLDAFKVSKDNKVFSSKDGVLFTKDRTRLVSYPAGKNATKYTVPSSVIEYSSYAFSGARILNTVNLSKNSCYISTGMFAYSGIKDLKMPESIKYIFPLAFYKCEDIGDSITIGKGVEDVSFAAFALCRGLKELKVEKGNKHFSVKNGVLYNKDKTILVSYPLRKKTKAFTIPKTVKKILPYAFYGNKNIENIIVPNGVKTIEEGVFSCCKSVKYIKIPNSVKKIKRSAFCGIPRENIDCNMKGKTISDFAFNY